jgi:hypothetical protein
MKNDKRDMQRMLEKATDAGDVSQDELDAEAASLRDAWLAFGQMLETAQPDSDVSVHLPDAAPCAPLFPGEAPIYAPLLLGEKRTRQSPAPWHWHVRAASLLALILFIAIVTTWRMQYPQRQTDPDGTQPTMASTDHKAAPTKQPRGQTLAKADEPQWDDSLDEPLAQVSWQMACIQQNQTLRTDAFGIIEYKLGQLSKAIQSDSPEN